MSEPRPPRGTPPNTMQLAQHLGDRLSTWNGAVAMVPEFGAIWRWAHSETTGQWSYRSYLPGERFFVSLSLTDGGFEASLNVKAEEWDFIASGDARERDRFDALRATAVATGEDPAWVHLPLTNEADLALFAKLLVARARRIQPARRKKRK